MPMSWMCKKQTSVSHSSTEAETISLDAGLRMDGIHALTLWDLVIEVFHSNRTKQKDLRESCGKTRQHLSSQTCSTPSQSSTQTSFQRTLITFHPIQRILIPLLCCMSLMKVRRMRHVSRTHRVALDWLIDRINLDPKIQIRYIDTKHQLADILTKGNFTRDEWNHLLCLFNISHFSSTTCLEVMSKRTEEDAGEERVTGKSKPMMNLVSPYSVRDPNVIASTASERPEKTKSERQNVPLPVIGASSSNYLEWNIDDKWSPQVWKSGEMLGTRTVRP